MEFNGKVAIVTGAGVGIGRETAIQLAKRGAVVVALDLNEEALQSLTAEMQVYSSKSNYYICNVADEETVIRTIKKTLSTYDKIDILINNAGIWRSNRGLFVDSKSEFWKEKINVNILGTMYCTRAVLGHMISQKYGKIVNLASVAGVYGNRMMVDYSMTKGAIIAFTTALAKEVSEYGINVNAVSPGNIISAANEKDNPNLSFMERSGSVEECANVICFLASDAASFVSGQNYLVDGCRKKM